MDKINIFKSSNIEDLITTDLIINNKKFYYLTTLRQSDEHGFCGRCAFFEGGNFHQKVYKEYVED